MGRELQLLQETPLLHIHSESDEIVPISQAAEYQTCRRGASGKTEFIRLSASNHNCSDYYEQELCIAKTAEWFKSTL